MAEVMSLKDKLAMFNKKIDKQSEEAQFEQQFKAKVVTFFFLPMNILLYCSHISQFL